MRVLVFACCLAFLLASPGAILAQKASTAPEPSPAAKASDIVNLNTASAAQLEALPGIGAKTAERIVAYREKNGPFKKIEDLMNVKGIGEKSFLKLKARLTVTPPAGPATE